MPARSQPAPDLDQGDANAQFDLGTMYELGHGVPERLNSIDQHSIVVFTGLKSARQLKVYAIKQQKGMHDRCSAGCHHQKLEQATQPRLAFMGADNP